MELRMTNQEVPKRFRDALKLIAVMQLALETMDSLKDTQLYRHRIKKQMKMLEKDLEDYVKKPLSAIDSINYQLFNHIQENIDLILSLDVNDLAELKVLFNEKQIQD